MLTIPGLENLPLAGKFVIAFAIIFVLLVLFALILRRLKGGKLSLTSERGRARQPRLGIVDVYDLDRQRQLILLRRDNVEHLLLVGGPNDVVVETNIVRQPGARLPAAPAADMPERTAGAGESAPARPVIDALPPRAPEPIGVPLFPEPPEPAPPARLAEPRPGGTRPSAQSAFAARFGLPGTGPNGADPASPSPAGAGVAGGSVSSSIAAGAGAKSPEPRVDAVRPADAPRPAELLPAPPAPAPAGPAPLLPPPPSGSGPAPVPAEPAAAERPRPTAPPRPVTTPLPAASPAPPPASARLEPPPRALPPQPPRSEPPSPKPQAAPAAPPVQATPVVPAGPAGNGAPANLPVPPPSERIVSAGSLPAREPAVEREPAPESAPVPARPEAAAPEPVPPSSEPVPVAAPPPPAATPPAPLPGPALPPATDLSAPGPAPAPAPSRNDPFSIEDIEAEFARLLGRSVEKRDDRA